MTKTGFLGALSVAAILAATAAHAEGCDPGQAAAKYPSLAGKTFRIGLDPQTPPYAQRDAANSESSSARTSI